jgi:mannose/cellobiose epimerase-like protein (N-acyl-D-glucosamine 2-epimerase family)
MLFFSRDFLRQHCNDIVAFYAPNIIDNTGGFEQNYYDDGSVFDSHFKQLVSSTRLVINYCRAASILSKPDLLAHARHGLSYVENVHWQENQAGFAWTLDNHQPSDMTHQAYGYAFVLLMYAHCLKAGVISDRTKIDYVYQLLEDRFYQAKQGIYADTLYADGRLCEYRGQNANMHICEALIACYQATNDKAFYERAAQLAKRFTVALSAHTQGLVWEHFTPELMPDLEYNKDDPKNLYRPWGFQVGHQTEWAKLLLLLNTVSFNQDRLDTAKSLFDKAYRIGWDETHGGLVYGFAPNEQVCDDDKYFWVQAESFAAAALLFNATQEDHYRLAYEQIWQYSWQHFVDHNYGAWFRVLNGKNEKYTHEKSAAGAKCDYHTLGACFDVIEFAL